jgi:hypothetical protein
LEEDPVLNHTIFDFLGGVIVSVLAIGTSVRRFKHWRWQWGFKGDKIPQHYFLRRGSKAAGPMSKDFTASKKNPFEV